MKKLVLTAMGILLITAGFTCSKSEEATQEEAPPAAVEESSGESMPMDESGGESMPMDESGDTMGGDEGASMDEAAPMQENNEAEGSGDESGH